jgi:23S rRNA (pseudouridine1915-N3)-methyltransferase
MRVKIMTVGKLAKGAIHELVAEYIKRLVWSVEIQEILPKRMATKEQQKQHEADLLRAMMPKGSQIIILDERGENPSSLEIAHRLATFQEQGRSSLCCVIGGADGLDVSIRDMADWIVSFGRMTWPHKLMPVLVLEQLYRAQQILLGHPYHRA